MLVGECSELCKEISVRTALTSRCKEEGNPTPTKRREIRREVRYVAYKGVQIALCSAETVCFFWRARVGQPVDFPDTELCASKPGWLTDVNERD